MGWAGVTAVGAADEVVNAVDVGVDESVESCMVARGGCLVVVGGVGTVVGGARTAVGRAVKGWGA